MVLNPVIVRNLSASNSIVSALPTIDLVDPSVSAETVAMMRITKSRG